MRNKVQSTYDKIIKHWILILLCFFSFLIVDGIGFSLSLFFVTFTSTFDTSSKSLISWIFSIHFAMTLISGPMASLLVNKYGCGRSNMIGGLLTFLGFFIGSFARAIWLLILSVGMLSGFGVAIVYVTCYTIIMNQYVDTKELVTGIFSCGSGIGALIIGPLTEFLINRYNWPGALLILSGLFMQILFFGLAMQIYAKLHGIKPVLKCEHPTLTSCTSLPQLNGVKNFGPIMYTSLPYLNRSSKIPGNPSLKQTYWKNLNYQIFLLSNFLLYASGDTPCIFTIERSIKLNIIQDNGFVVSLLGISNTVGHIFFGFLAHVMVRKLGTKGNFVIYGTGIIIAGIATVFVPHMYNAYQIYFFIIVLGFFISANYTLTPIITADIVDSDCFSYALGYVFTAQGLGALIGAPIGGLFIDHFKNYYLCFYLAGIFICISGLMLFLNIITFTKTNRGKK